jgi:hypothetical protein
MVSEEFTNRIGSKSGSTGVSRACSERNPPREPEAVDQMPLSSPLRR